MAEGRVQRRLAAILAADVAGYSRLMGADEETTLRTLKGHREIIDGLIVRHDGRVFGTAGDSVMAEFASAVEAVRAATAIQEELKARNAELPTEGRMMFRIGVNLGDIMVEGDNLFGDGVNVAARLEGVAEPGGICISGSAFDQVKNKNLAVSFTDLGLQEVKNIAEPVRTYAVCAVEEGSVAPTLTGEALSLPHKPSIAVLPFDNMSGDPEQEYFSDGISEDLITALSRIRHFEVIARNSTFSYKGTSPDVRQVSKDLGANYVVEGSVRKAGNRVRVSAQLIDGATGNHIWADRYDRDLEDIFAVQDELTLTLVGAIEPEMNKSEQQRASTQRSKDPDVWDLYHRGMWHLSRRSIENYREASVLFEKAMELDDNFAPAFSAYAECVGRSLLTRTEQGDRDKAVRSARRAIELDNSDSMGHLALGILHLFDRDLRQAKAEFESSLRINPSSAAAHNYLGTALMHAGQAEDALPHLIEAVRLSPADSHASSFNSRVGMAYFFLGEYDAALEWTDKAIRMPGSNWPMRVFRLAALAELGRDEDASAALTELLEFRPDVTIALVRDRLPTSDETYQENLRNGLRKAGLPEK